MADNPAPGQKRGPEPVPKDERITRLEEELNGVLDSDAFLKVAEEVAGDASIRSEAKANPRGLLRRKPSPRPGGPEAPL